MEIIFEMVFILGGWFLLGSLDIEFGREDVEGF